MRRTRHNQEDLNLIALSRAHQFQKVALKELFAHDWRASLVAQSRRGNVMVVMRHAKDSKIGCAVYPDGSFGRSKTPTVKWDWARVDRAAEATVPDAYVRDILARPAK